MIRFPRTNTLGYPVVRDRATGLYFHVRCRPGTFSDAGLGERLMLRVVADLVMAVLLVVACMTIATGVVALITATIRTKRRRGR